MLRHVAAWLAEYYSGFNVFQYLTLRAILAALTALAISLLVGPRMIRWLAEYQVGQRVRSDGPQTHLTKAGTPTMGGALILAAIVAATLLWADLANRFVWIVLLVTLAFGLIGFWDDYLKLVVGNSRGLIARYKYFWQSVAGLGARDRAVRHRAVAGRDDAVRAVLQARRACRSACCFIAAHLLRDRRHEQRGEPDRRPRRPRDHAGRARRRARSACSRTRRATSCSRTTSASRTSPAPARCS